MELLAINSSRSTGIVRSAGCVCLMAILLASGCSRTLLTEQADLGERLDVDAFWHDHLATQPMVTTAEAFRAVLLLADGDEQQTDFASRQAALEERGIVRPAWKLQREAAIDRGSVAYMVCRVMQIKGGINLTTSSRLGVGDRRYAVRELVHRRMLQRGADYQYLTGGEMMDLLIEADRYMSRHGHYESDEPDVAELLKSPADGSQEPSITP